MGEETAMLRKLRSCFVLLDQRDYDAYLERRGYRVWQIRYSNVVAAVLLAIFTCLIVVISYAALRAVHDLRTGIATTGTVESVASGSRRGRKGAQVATTTVHYNFVDGAGRTYRSRVQLDAEALAGVVRGDRIPLRYDRAGPTRVTTVAELKNTVASAWILLACIPYWMLFALALRRQTSWLRSQRQNERQHSAGGAGAVAQICAGAS